MCAAQSGACPHRSLFLFISRAEALQSVIQLLGEKELYDYYSDQYKVHSINWSPEKAKTILEAWQRKFTEVRQFCTKLPLPLRIYAQIYTPSPLEDKSAPKLTPQVLVTLSRIFFEKRVSTCGGPDWEAGVGSGQTQDALLGQSFWTGAWNDAKQYEFLWFGCQTRLHSLPRFLRSSSGPSVLCCARNNCIVHPLCILTHFQRSGLRRHIPPKMKPAIESERHCRGGSGIWSRGGGNPTFRSFSASTRELAAQKFCFGRG